MICESLAREMQQSLCDEHIAGIRRALDRDQENRVRPQIVEMVLVATPTWCRQ